MKEKLYTARWTDHNGKEVTLKSALTIAELPKMIEALLYEGKNPEVIIV